MYGWIFTEAPDPDPLVLGGKGAGLVRMTRLGLPVPPGFVLGTATGREYLRSGRLPDGLLEEVRKHIAVLEDLTGRRFGDEHAPLLVSVRSGAPVSMPGMMDTVLNVGLTAGGTRALAAAGGDEHFAATCWERLLHGFATTVRGIPAAIVEEALLDLPAGADAADRAAALEVCIAAESGQSFPDAHGQLAASIEAVFASWNSPRARAYRRHKGIDEALGTAVVVQAMVFGNRGEDSGSGVCFTRDPGTGAAGSYGDVLFNAQGEDVVSGERDTLPLAELGNRLPGAAAQLDEVCRILEADVRDMCDIEFTIEDGRLWVLQTRVGQRSGRAAVRIAVALTREGLIDREEALRRVSDEQLTAALRPVVAEPVPTEAILGRGLACCPGAVTGVATLDCRIAQERGQDGTEVVLIRPTTSPADLPGVLAAKAVVTARGGRASHAAVVARGLDKPTVCGTGPLPVAEGEIVTVDGDRGLVLRGSVPLAPGHTDPSIATFLEWRNADRG